ncbi:cytochrome P450 [Tricladium varicosporioides]|nr:cytochrome P450 [Hymenoscyphus varicosporioides]
MLGLRELALAALTYGIAHIIIVAIYRILFHPYSKYPGPLLAKFTTLYGAWHAYYGDVHLDIERCHAKYGKFVRYGPNSLLVNSVNGFHDIYGPLKRTKKSKSYTVHGETNLIGIQDKTQYARAKKIFQQGFSDSANREHEPKVVQEVDIFVGKMLEGETKTGGKGDGMWTEAKDMSVWCNYFTTDVVAKVIFTTSWDLMTSTTNRSLSETFKTIVRLVGVLHYWPHMAYHELTALLCLPHLAWSVKALREFSLAVMKSSKEAREKDPSIKDVFGIFSEVRDEETGKLALNADDVRRNTGNFIIAGSDTTSSTLAAFFFYVTRNADAYARIANEIRTTFSTKESIRAGPLLNSCIYLRAALNETLRLSPVAPQPLWREAEPGLVVDGQSVPSGLNVGAGIYSLHQNSSIFPNPKKYDMMRWVIDDGKDEDEEKERLKEMNRSFAPFSVGPRQCLAKNFAWMEMLLVTARTFHELDFERVGDKGVGQEGEFVMKSYFTSYMEGPIVRFKRREC